MREVERWPDETLRAWSREHLWYEVHMFRLARSVNLLAEEVETSPQAYAIQMALIEARANHARVLIDFLYKDNPRKKNAIVAADFFDDASRWKSIRPAKSEALKRIVSRTNHEVVHLTADRISGSPPAKAWDGGRFQDVDATLRVFAGGALPQRLDPEVSKLITSGVSMTSVRRGTVASSSVPELWTFGTGGAAGYGGGTVPFGPLTLDPPR